MPRHHAWPTQPVRGCHPQPVLSVRITVMPAALRQGPTWLTSSPDGVDCCSPRPRSRAGWSPAPAGRPGRCHGGPPSPSAAQTPSRGVFQAAEGGRAQRLEPVRGDRRDRLLGQAEVGEPLGPVILAAPCRGTNGPKLKSSFPADEVPACPTPGPCTAPAPATTLPVPPRSDDARRVACWNDVLLEPAAGWPVGVPGSRAGA